jgi:hypothetical protein
VCCAWPTDAASAWVRDECAMSVAILRPDRAKGPISRIALLAQITCQRVGVLSPQVVFPRPVPR